MREMAQKRQGSRAESATGFLETVGLSEPSDQKNGKNFRWTIKRRRFCHNLVRNGGQIGKAATDAGYNTTEEGTYLLRLPQIKKYIEIDLRNHLDAEAVTEESVITRWANWASVDISDYVEKDRRVKRRGQVRMRSPWNVDAQARKCIKKLTVKDLDDGAQELTIEFHDAMKANEKLAQVLGLMAADRDDKTVNAEETAREIFDAIQQMRGMYGDASGGSEAADADRSVDEAPRPPGSA
jgi:phage terminase small subunit